MKHRRIRVVALAAVRRDDGAVLVQRGTDPVSGQAFHRLVGGGVDVGERAAEAVVREWREELDADLREVRLVGWLENIFTWDSRPAHELLAVHVGTVADRHVLDRDHLGCIPGTDSEALWVPVAELLHGPAPLYPEGLAELLAPWFAGDP